MYKRKTMAAVLFVFALTLANTGVLPIPYMGPAGMGGEAGPLSRKSVLTVSAKKKKKKKKKKKISYVKVKSCYSKLKSYRKKKGVAGIARSAALEKYARIRAKELVKKYSHTRPNGRRGFEIIPAGACGTIDVGYHHYYFRGENIARGQKTCKKVMKAWYKSPPHRQNMLNPNFRKVGIAGCKYKRRIYWVQLFSS